MHLDFSLLVNVNHSLFLFHRSLCFQLWAKNLQWLSNPWPNRKRDWAAQAATCYTFNKSLAFVSLVLFVTKAMAFTSNLTFCCDLYSFFSSNTVLDLSGQLAFSRVRSLLLAVFTPRPPPFHFFSPPLKFLPLAFLNIKKNRIHFPFFFYSWIS